MLRRYRKWRLTRLVWNGKISINEARARLGLQPWQGDWANRP
jgi:hypothetical protein